MSIEILGEPVEIAGGLLGTVVLTWTLSSEPDADWIKAFDVTSVTYEGPGAKDFLVIARPLASERWIRWTVPANLKEHARQYIVQRIAHANSSTET